MGRLVFKGQSLAPSKVKLLKQKLIQPAEGNDTCIRLSRADTLPAALQTETVTWEVRNAQTFAQGSLQVQ